MKKLIFFFLALSLTGYSQIDTTTYVHMDIIGITSTGSWGTSAKSTQRMDVSIDFGDGKFYTPEKPYVDSITRQPMVFNSIIAAMNYFSTIGWKFEFSLINDQSTGSVTRSQITHVFMKKQKYGTVAK